MKFYPENKPVPEKLTKAEFIIRPLRATDVELDYQAVVASREKLLKRTGGSWPRVGFTIEENLSDLEKHEQQHQDRNEFTFTIMNVTESECLGCIYIHPLEKRLRKKVDGTVLEKVLQVVNTHRLTRTIDQIMNKEIDKAIRELV